MSDFLLLICADQNIEGSSPAQTNLRRSDNAGVMGRRECKDIGAAAERGPSVTELQLKTLNGTAKLLDNYLIASV